MMHEVKEIGSGWTGTDETVREIERLVEDAILDPVVVETAHNIVRNVPERDKMGEARAISEWVRSHVRYTNERVETIKTPRYMIDEIAQYGKAVGDCDDHVTLWAALHSVVGNPVRFRVISQRPDRIANHIYGEVYVNGRWVPDELIVKNRPLGWSIPRGEVTKDRVYYSGVSAMDTPVVGGGFKVPSEAFFGSRNGMVRVDPQAAQSYHVLDSRGGMRFSSGSGVEGMGILPAIAAAAPALTKTASLVKSFKKKKKKSRGEAPFIAPAPSPPPQEGGLMKNIPIIAGAAVVLAVLLLRR